MANSLKIGIWNANGLAQRSQELKTFILQQNIDIMLTSETHFTKKSYLRMAGYTIYETQHPDGLAHGGTAIIIKTSIKHCENEKFARDYLQATAITIEDCAGPITLSAIYSPPKHNIKEAQYTQFFKTLGNRFIAGGDYNAKHPWWGSRSNVPTPKGKQLYLAMQANNLTPLSTGEPTYWPSDRRKTPDLIDFCVLKSIPNTHLSIQSSFDLSSDHSPLIVTLSTSAIRRTRPPKLHTKKTNWYEFKNLLSNIHYAPPLKTTEELDEAIVKLNQFIEEAAWAATPPEKETEFQNHCTDNAKQKIMEKRKLRKQWQQTRSPHDKAKLNKAVKEVKKILEEERNTATNRHLQGLSATIDTDYSLWKATKNIKQPQQRNPPLRLENGEWARTNKEKAQAFAEHLEKTFTPFPSETPKEEEDIIFNYIDSPLQMELPIKKVKVKEVKYVINKNLNQRKAPGWDLITGKILKELPENIVKTITALFNAALRLEYFPIPWKVAEIILIAKPGKIPENVSSYRPISLLPVMSKVFEKLILKRITPVLHQKQLIPEHQCGFREHHGTIEQVHRVVRQINLDLEEKRFCSAVFLDVSQAFDKVWHLGLLYKIKRQLPHNIYNLLKSYLSDRQFYVKQQDECTKLSPIQSGVPQGSVLGPVLYLLYTADLPVSPFTTIATFADDTTVMASHKDPGRASAILQGHINKIQSWLRIWRIKVNEQKSTHVTFTTKRDNCPPITLNNQQIPQDTKAKYLGIHLDRRMTWRRHIEAKKKQLNLKLKTMYWLIGRRSPLSLANKVLLYKVTLKPIWNYGIQLWGSASASNIEILERFQAKTLRIMVNAPWFVTNAIIRRDLQISTVKEEARKCSAKYSEKLAVHPNRLVRRLVNESNDTRRLKRFKPSDIVSRY